MTELLQKDCALGWLGVLYASRWRLSSFFYQFPPTADAAPFERGRERDAVFVVGDDVSTEGDRFPALAQTLLEGLKLGIALLGATQGESAPGNAGAVLLGLVDVLHFEPGFRLGDIDGRHGRRTGFVAVPARLDGFFVAVATAGGGVGWAEGVGEGMFEGSAAFW